MKAMLFDLDGTLLPIDFGQFLSEYLKRIAAYCSGLVEPEKFTQALLAATGVMLRNQGPHSNETVFWNVFPQMLNLRREEIYPLVEKFYEEDFPQLSSYTRQTKVAPLILQEVIQRGWKIILATNPVFPLVAIKHRMDWAGVGSFPWLYITTYENSSSCKPSLMYYQQILERFSLRPENCWMVGNDTEEDLIAGSLGVNTYLVTDFLLDKGNEYPAPAGRGKLSDFLQFIREMD